VIRNGKRRDTQYFVRVYNPTEIRDLLSRAGFEIYKIYGGWDAESFTSDSRRMIILAQKRR
jgi:hypothetical protein